MTNETANLLQTECELRSAQAVNSSHLAMRLRMRGVRYARMRCQTVWCETLASRQARLFTPSLIVPPQPTIS